MSKAQAHGYAKLSEYRLASHDLHEYFSTNLDKNFVEIGFGNGEVLAHIAQQNPTWQCVGVDVYRPGIGSLVSQCERMELKNLRIVEDEATSVLESVPNDTVDLLFVLFPDPWPKLRHQRRRLVNAEFAVLLHHKISATGIVYFATDAADYANQIQTAMSESFSQIEINQIKPIPQTRYRQKAVEAGHSIWDLAYSPSRTHDLPTNN